MKIFNIWVILMAVTFTGTAQYYNGLDTSLRCGDFKTALHNHITANTTVRSYDDLIGAHATYDIHKSDDGLRTIIWDMYSDNPSGAELTIVRAIVIIESTLHQLHGMVTNCLCTQTFLISYQQMVMLMESVATGLWLK